MEVKTVGIACDHAGFPLKQFVVQYLEEKKYPYKDFGCNSDLSCDYPDYAHSLAEVKSIQESQSAEAAKAWQLRSTNTRECVPDWLGTKT